MKIIIKKEIEKRHLKKSFIIKCLIIKGINKVRASNLVNSDKYVASSHELELINEIIQDLCLASNLEFFPIKNIENEVLKKYENNLKNN